MGQPSKATLYSFVRDAYPQMLAEDDAVRSAIFSVNASRLSTSST
jgi:hypothetical protein